MTLEEYRDAWKWHPEPDHREPDEEELLARVREESATFAKTIGRHDRLETAAVVAAGLVIAKEGVGNSTGFLPPGQALRSAPIAT